MANQAMDVAYYQQEEEKARLRQRLSKEAIDLALEGKWEEAEALNRAIVEKFPADVEAYNRLGRALTELRDFDRAKEAYLKALELAPENVIAKKNLARLASLSGSLNAINGEPQKALMKAQARKVDPEFFATEMGKAGVVNLHNVAPSEVLAQLGYGDQVHLEIRGQHLIVKDGSGEYLGELEPRQALRLIKLMQGGNKYDAAILTVAGDEVKVVIKEVYRHPSQLGRPSFPVKAGERFRSHILESLLKRRAIAEEAEAVPGVEYSEEEEYSGHEHEEEEPLPEGFSVVGEDDERGV